MSLPPYLFLPDDYDALQARIKKIAQDVADLQGTIGDSTRDSSETWHDNFMFEEGQRQLDVLNRQFSELTDMLTRAHIVEASDGTHPLGKKITYRDALTGKEGSITLGSYLLLDQKPQTASYSSPIGQIFAEASRGATVTGMIGGEERRFEILDIL